MISLGSVWTQAALTQAAFLGMGEFAHNWQKLDKGGQEAERVPIY